VEEGIWPNQKFWRSALYARPLAGFKRAASRRGVGEKEGRGTEREKRGRKEEKGSGGKLKQGRQLAKAGPVYYRAKRSVARYCHDKLSVRLSVRL